MIPSRPSMRSFTYLLVPMLVLAILPLQVAADPQIDIVYFRSSSEEVEHFSNLQFHVQIKNVGDTEANNAEVTLFCNDQFVAIESKQLGPNTTHTFDFEVMIDDTYLAGINDFKIVTDTSEKHLSILVVPRAIVNINFFAINERELSTGDLMRISIQIQNFGTADALNVTVRYYIEEEMIGSQVIALIHAGGSQSTSFEYKIPPSLQDGTYEVYVTVGDIDHGTLIFVTKKTIGNLSTSLLLSFGIFTTIMVVVAFLVMGVLFRRKKPH
jgi:uncharacterized membrane protein